MIWRWTFIKSDTTEVAVKEPVGWDGISGNLQRNMIHHGIFINITTGSIEWVDDALILLSAEYNTNGADGQMQLKIEYKCNDTYFEYFMGNFDFNTYEKSCGDYCFISCEVNATKCTDTFLSRMGQDVDVLSAENFDGEAISPMSYTPLNIVGQDIFLQNKAFNIGTNTGNGQIFPFGASSFYYFSFCPVVPANNLQEIGNFNLNGTSLALTSSGNVSVASAFTTDAPGSFNSFGQFLTIWERTSDPLNCIDNDAYIDIVCKGTFNVTFTNFGGEITPTLKLFKYNSTTGTLTLLDTNSIGTIACSAGVTQSLAFNKTYAATPSYADADYLMYFFECFVERLVWDGFSIREINFNIDFDNTTKIVMSLDSDCAPTVTRSVPLTDLLEHLPTAYMGTDCPLMEVESDLKLCLDKYSITKGSFIRNVTEPSVPKLFTSFEWLFEQCRKIFNIGWGFTDNESALKIARIDGFYKPNVVANVGVLDKTLFTTAKDLIYGTINVGYNKWEAEEYNGLDETNTERQYRRNISSNPTELDLMTDIISAGYTIEITRRKSQAQTGTSDWRYDDDLFIINTNTIDSILYAHQGVDANADSVYSPSTRMNYALTPARSLMRWFKSIAAARPTVASENYIFTSGTGNYIAQGQMLFNCPIEGSTLAEDETIDVSNFDNPYYITPIWETIYATFNAPLSMAQYELIKADVYGAIQFQCGSDIYLGNIVDLNHDPNVGLANFKLLIRR